MENKGAIESHKHPKKSIPRRLWNNFLIGLLVTMPLVLSGFLFVWLFNIFDGPLTNLLEKYTGYYIPGVGIIAFIIGVLIVGAVSANILGHRLFNLGEKILSKIPFFSGLYGTFRDLTHTIVAVRKEKFSSVVLLEYPRKGIFSVGFVTGKFRGEYERLSDKDILNIFVPTTPFPTNGFYILVPAKEVIPTKMTVEEGLKLVISGGMIMPHDKPPEDIVSEAMRLIETKAEEKANE